MKTIGLAAVMVFLMGLALPGYAIPPGQKIEFTKSPMGKVVLDGNTHPAKGIMCDGCHPKPFAQKKGTAKITLADHQNGKFCFTCHKEGGKAWPAKDNCNKCHIKPK
ncbi:MAG: cytochrome c3 family protein [Gammaproteobacteria bacterium]|jgi:c(7)-type cytochrome triheme protein